MTNFWFIKELHLVRIVLPCLLSACAIKPQMPTQTPEELSQDEQLPPPSFSTDVRQPRNPGEAHDRSTHQTAMSTRSKYVDLGSNNKSEDLWQRLRHGFKLPASLNQPRVQVYLNRYQQHSYMQRISSRAKPFLYFIFEEVKRRGMPTELALLPAVESAYQTSAYSGNRAAGLWQFTPETGLLYDLKQNWWYDGRLDVYAATHAALSYLADLNQYFDGDWLLTLAAYNAGPRRILRAIELNKRQGKSTRFWDLKLPNETRNYVPKLLALRAIVQAPQKVGITLPPIAYKPVIAAIEVDTQIDLGFAAMLADVKTQTITLLNPGFKRWASDPDGPHRLFVPIDSVMGFKQRLAERLPDDSTTWLRHNIKKGETLSSIASHYQTTVNFLQQANKLQTHRIKADSYLLVPRAASFQHDNMPFKPDQSEKADSTLGKIHLTRSTIKAEESSSSIPRRYTIKHHNLDRRNGMPIDNIAKTSDKPLILKHTDITNLQPTTNTEAVIIPKQGSKVIQYSVKKGDTLYRIAKRFSVHVTDLQRWNNLAHNHLLFPDQAITVHVEHDLSKQQQYESQLKGNNDLSANKP